MRALVCALLLVVAGCGGPPDAVRDTISVAATGLKAVDEVLAPRYTDRAEECREASTNWEEYDSCVGVLNTAAVANETSREGLLTLEASADAWEEGASEDWPALVACVAVAFGRLEAALAAVGVPIPDEVRTAINLAAAFGGECDGSL